MKKKSYFIVLMIMLLFSLTLVPAQPPFQQSGDTGISLETPIIEYHKVNQSYSFHVHAHNATSGLLLKNDTTTCIMHVYQPSDGEHIFEGVMGFCPDNNIDFELELEAGNFTELGQYAVVFYCEIPGEIGGFFEYGFDITKTGSSLDLSESLIYFILAFGVLLLFIISFYFMIITPYGNDVNEKGAVIKITKLKYVKLGFILLTWVLFTWFLNILIGLSDNFVRLTMYYGFFGFMFNLMNTLALWVGLIVLVIAFFEIIRDSNLQKNLELIGGALK